MSYLVRFFISISLLFVFNSGYSQKIIIIDSSDNLPISNVTVFGKQSLKSLISNDKGIVDLEQFHQNDTLLIGHISYSSVQLINNLTSNNTTVFLEPNTQALSEVILSVARNKESREKISKQVSLITNKDLKMDLPQTSADLLTYASGVRVQKSQGGGGSPIIRGFEANRVLLVIDGVRMNNAIYRSGHLQNSITINPNSLERTEVIYGPSSVGYGSDALGGVVHFYTKTPKINNTKKWITGGISSYNSRLNNIVQNLDLEFSSNKWASYTNFSFSKFGDIVMGNNRKHGFDDWGLDNHYLYPGEYNDSIIINDNPEIQQNTSYQQYDLMQ
ncbi:TonB-dependent receptor plug domain-containing protein, partial [Flavobacteriaceae bacterium]|nr:TonB-dependent receptor plug domain-containing protein [Flavobacteriaceae bacterium]